MSLDSHVQIKRTLLKEINDWITCYNVVIVADSEIEEIIFETKKDLLTALFDKLEDGAALDPEIPATLPYEDEHYN